MCCAGVIDEWPRPLPELGPIELTAAFTGKLLGIPIDATEIATTLAQLGFAVEQDGATLAVMPPFFRRDVSLPEDLVEEVGRMIGYARVPSTLPGRRAEVTTTAAPPPIEDAIRDVCVGAGFDEAITFSFVGPLDAALLPGLGRDRKPIPLRNPLSDEWSVMRTSQLPRLCASLAGNVNRGSGRRDALRARQGVLGRRAGGAACPDRRPTEPTATFRPCRSSRCC